MSQLGDTSVGDPWRRPPLLFSSVRRAMVGCPPELYPQAHNTHSYPLPTHSHKYGDDRVLHRLVREEVQVRARRPKARGRLKPTGHHEWQPSAVAPLRTSCDIRSSVIPSSRDSFLQSSSSFQTESSSTCSCACLRVKPECCRMPDHSQRGWGLPGPWSNGL